jgi:hypothetical protein
MVSLSRSLFFCMLINRLRKTTTCITAVMRYGERLACMVRKITSSVLKRVLYERSARLPILFAYVYICVLLATKKSEKNIISLDLWLTFAGERELI